MNVQAQQTNSRMTGMITPLLPKASAEAPMLLETEFAPGMHLFIGATSELSADRPGNGGFRIWKYDSKEDAAAEVPSYPCACLVQGTCVCTRDGARKGGGDSDQAYGSTQHLTLRWDKERYLRLP